MQCIAKENLMSNRTNCSETSLSLDYILYGRFNLKSSSNCKFIGARSKRCYSDSALILSFTHVTTKVN